MKLSKTALLDRHAPHAADRPLLGRLLDLSDLADRTGRAQSSHFLDPRQQALATALLLLLPALGAAALARFFRPASPRAPFLGLPLQWGLALLLSQPLGDLLGFRLGSFAWDLFDWIAYGIFIVGWSVGAALVQFVTLFLLERRARP